MSAQQVLSKLTVILYEDAWYDRIAGRDEGVRPVLRRHLERMLCLQTAHIGDGQRAGQEQAYDMYQTTHRGIRKLCGS